MRHWWLYLYLLEQGVASCRPEKNEDENPLVVPEEHQHKSQMLDAKKTSLYKGIQVLKDEKLDAEEVNCLEKQIKASKCYSSGNWMDPPKCSTRELLEACIED